MNEEHKKSDYEIVGFVFLECISLAWNYNVVPPLYYTVLNTVKDCLGNLLVIFIS